jgi:hypothetical protein
MSKRDQSRTNLADLISDMESDVRDLTYWADTVFQLGSSDDCPAGPLLVVGPAMQEVAKRVEASWEAAFRMSQDLREGTR